jgi:hypothetical protein
MRARAWIWRLACVALLLGVVGSAVGERPKNEPPRSGGGLGQATVPNTFLFAVNRVIFQLQDVGEIGSSGSSVAGGGFWKATTNQYVFSSGANVGAKLPDGTIVFANGGPFSELDAGSLRFPELGVYWDSNDPSDRASFPEVCSVDAPRIARFPSLASFAGEPFPGFADQTVCIAVNDYTGGTCGECAGTRVGVTIVETLFAFGVPTVQDFVFVMIRMYNDTKFLNSENAPLQPPGPYALSETVFSFAMDPDIGDAGDDQAAFLPDIQTAAFWDVDFTESGFQGALGVGGTGLVVLPTDPVTGAEIPLAEFSLFTNGAPRPDPNAKEIWYAIQRGDPTQVILEVDPRDVRWMVSTVPFTLPPDAFVEMGAAYFFADIPGAPPASLRAEAYKNLATGQLNPTANDDPVFGPLRAAALVAQASGNAGFLQPVAPPAPDFTQIPGDHQITIVWNADPVTSSNPFARIVRAPFNTEEPVATGIILAPGDVVFFNGQFQTAAQAGIAGQEVTNVNFNPNFVVFDFEGFRVYRSRTGLTEDAELIAQFDIANSIAGGEFCLSATAVFDADGNFVQNVCTAIGTQAGPGGSGAGEAARFGSNTGLQFSVVDRGGSFPDPSSGPGLINGIPVAHAVTSFGVNCGILLPVIPVDTETVPPAACLSLESGKIFKLATPESDPSTPLTAAIGDLVPLTADGSDCNVDEPTATVDPNTGEYTDFIDCSNAIVSFSFNPVVDVDIPTADYFLEIDRISAGCAGVSPSCYTLATGNADNTVHFHWERADGSLATEMFPSTGSFNQDFGFFVAAEASVPATLFDADDNPVLAFSFVVASDFSVIEDLEINGQSLHLGELGGAHAGEARPHAITGSSLADVVNLGMRRTAAGTVAREYSHPSFYAQGGTSYDLIWEVSGGTFTGTVRQVPGGNEIPKGGQPINAENHSTAADNIPGWNWCFITPGTTDAVAAATAAPRAGPCAPNNTINLAVGNNFAVYVPGQSVYIQGLKQLPQNGDVWRFLIDTGSQRGLFGREGGGADPNVATAPFSYHDVNDASEQGIVLEPVPFDRGIVNVYPGARWKLSLTGGARGDLATADLDAIQVVPNPFIAVNEAMRGRGLQRILFTNLPPVATIRIYTISGNMVRSLEHTDGSGTEEFDVRTRFDLLLASGNYYYHVTTPDGRVKLGRFAVIN